MKQYTDNQMRELLRPGKVEIEDGGFSRRVMSRLPVNRSQRSFAWVEWLCGMVGVVILFLSGGVRLLLEAFISALFNIPYYLKLVLFCLEANGVIGVLLFSGVIILSSFLLIYMIIPEYERYQ